MATKRCEWLSKTKIEMSNGQTRDGSFEFLLISLEDQPLLSRAESIAGMTCQKVTTTIWWQKSSILGKRTKRRRAHFLPQSSSHLWPNKARQHVSLSLLRFQSRKRVPTNFQSQGPHRAKSPQKWTLSRNWGGTSDGVRPQGLFLLGGEVLPQCCPMPLLPFLNFGEEKKVPEFGQFSASSPAMCIWNESVHSSDSAIVVALGVNNWNGWQRGSNERK